MPMQKMIESTTRKKHAHLLDTLYKVSNRHCLY